MEREFRDKSAGFRTIIFICVGSTLFTIFSLKLGEDQNPLGVTGFIVSGVGFLGAGAIFKSRERIVGLTTASTIWLSAALGIGIGGGYFLMSSIAASVILIILWVFPRIEVWIDNFRDVRIYDVTCSIAPDSFEKLEGLFVDCGLHVKKHKRIKSGEDMICTWRVHGSPKAHDLIIEKLFAHTDVKEFKF